MKNKNGFTLTELLAVIVILALLTGMSVFVASKLIANSQKATQEKIIENVKDAAISKYLSDNEKLSNDCARESLPTDSNCKKEYKIEVLINEGFLQDSSNKLDKEKKATVYKYKDNNNNNNIEVVAEVEEDIIKK